MQFDIFVHKIIAVLIIYAILALHKREYPILHCAHPTGKRCKLPVAEIFRFQFFLTKHLFDSTAIAAVAKISILATFYAITIVSSMAVI